MKILRGRIVVLTLLFLAFSVCVFEMKKIGLWIGGIVLSLFFVVWALYQFYFLRDPLRNIPNDDRLFVSPANGKIIAILKYDEQLKDTLLYKQNNVVIDDWTAGFSSGATLISIMMTPLDVHYQKAPLAAQLLSKNYKTGAFLNVMKADPLLTQTFQNEHNSMLFQTAEGYQFRIIQIAGALARRIVDYVQPHQQLQQGEKIGLIKLGSQVSVVLDSNFEVLAQVGDVVIDGETVLAKKK